MDLAIVLMDDYHIPNYKWQMFCQGIHSSPYLSAAAE